MNDMDNTGIPTDGLKRLRVLKQVLREHIRDRLGELAEVGRGVSEQGEDLVGVDPQSVVVAGGREGPLVDRAHDERAVARHRRVAAPRIGHGQTVPEHTPATSTDRPFPAAAQPLSAWYSSVLRRSAAP